MRRLRSESHNRTTQKETNKQMRLLLISSSRASGFGYLDYPREHIKRFLGCQRPTIAFIPYAGIRSQTAGLSAFDDYERRVQPIFSQMGFDLVSVHHDTKPQRIVETCDAIVAGGGNTFNLLNQIQEHDLVDLLKQRITDDGVPFIGWSAGANLACPTIRTTNDMPIVEPHSLAALNLVPFQLNPHYSDETLQDHFGETRQARLAEFLELNQAATVVGLPEGAMLTVEQAIIHYHSIFNHGCFVFRHEQPPMVLHEHDDYSFLLT